MAPRPVTACSDDAVAVRVHAINAFKYDFDTDQAA